MAKLFRKYKNKLKAFREIRKFKDTKFKFKDDTNSHLFIPLFQGWNPR